MKRMRLSELIIELQGMQDEHGDDEIGYEVGKDSIDILIGEDPENGRAVTIPNPKWK